MMREESVAGYRRISAATAGSIAAVAAILRGGGVAAFPTETFYGLAADPRQAAAVERLLRIKGRTAFSPLPLIVPSFQSLGSLFPPLSETACLLARTFWPGPLTLALPAPAGLHSATVSSRGATGVRVPGSGIARSLAEAAGGVLTATSANLAGAPPSTRPGDVEAILSNVIDCLLDGGETPGGLPSTVLDLSGEEPLLVREGAIPVSAIETVTGLKVRRSASL